MGLGEAPAKAILLGEHAVVYGYPAVAVPLPEMRARTQARFDNRSGDVVVEAGGRGLRVSVAANPNHPLAVASRLALEEVGAAVASVRVRLDSSIPVAAGLGSGAAVSAAVIRAITALFGRELPDAVLSDLVYQVEKLHHGNPSGIDNTVVAHGRPVLFRRGEPPEFPRLGAALTLLVADSGQGSLTREAVSGVRRARDAEPEPVDGRLARIGLLVEEAVPALVAGNGTRLGELMTENQRLLRELGVSSPELDALVGAAGEAGALGAKLTGAGRGGHAIALVTEATAPAVSEALSAAGARRVTVCRVPAHRP